MSELKEAKDAIGVNDVYRQAYYRLKERNQVLENRCLHLESSTAKFKERAKDWLNNLEAAMMAAQQLVIAQQHTVYANACINETYYNIKKQAKHCEESIKKGVRLKDSIDKNWPKVQKQLENLETIKHRLGAEQRMNNKLAKRCDELEKDRDGDPRYQKLLRKSQNVELRLKRETEKNESQNIQEALN